MVSAWVIVLGHQVCAQGMFMANNIAIQRKTGEIAAKTRTEMMPIVAYTVFIVYSLIVAVVHPALPPLPVLVCALGLLGLNLAIGATAFVHLGDSWRVGVLEGQDTALVTSGIYRLTRNPYFVGYHLMVLGYTLLLLNVGQ
ncbi:phospholipid methyltransferase, partial [Kipferlia bialata]|eukprot:g15330.t1